MSTCDTFEQLERLLSMKKGEDEPPIECTKKFKQAKDDVESIMGTEWLDKITENMEEHINKIDNDAMQELKKHSNKLFVAHMFLQNSDSLMCKSLKKLSNAMHTE